MIRHMCRAGNEGRAEGTEGSTRYSRFSRIRKVAPAHESAVYIASALRLTKDTPYVTGAGILIGNRFAAENTHLPGHDIVVRM